MVKKNENISDNFEMCVFCINTHTHTIIHYCIILFAGILSGVRYDIRGGNFFFKGVFRLFLYPHFA